MTEELGFNNTYALVMRRDAAERGGIRTISELRAHPELKFGLTHEFIERRDGWQPLAQRYGIATRVVSGIDHGLGYEALRTGAIDVKDAYSTDAKIAENDLNLMGSSADRPDRLLPGVYRDNRRRNPQAAWPLS